MDIWTLLSTFLRRWYVSLPVVALAAMLGHQVAQEQEPLYQAQASAVLTPPQVVEDPRAPGGFTETNPLLGLGGSISTTTNVLVVRMDSIATRQRYEEAGILPDYEVDAVDSVMFFDVEGEDEDEVIRTANRLVELADVEIAGMQEFIEGGPELRIRAIPVSVPLEAVENTSGAKVVLALSVALGLALAQTAAVALDGFLRWRRGRPGRGAGAAGPIRHVRFPRVGARHRTGHVPAAGAEDGTPARDRPAASSPVAAAAADTQSPSPGVPRTTGGEGAAPFPPTSARATQRPEGDEEATPETAPDDENPQEEVSLAGSGPRPTDRGTTSGRTKNR
jgi:hypothetical protein